MDSRLTIAVNAVNNAGTYLRDQFHKRHTVTMKLDNTELLGEDVESEKRIVKALSLWFPSDSILTEETETTISKDNVWVIDPLCGSYSYLRGVETWSISVALVLNGEYQLGVVYQPLLGNMFTAEQGVGAYLNKIPIHMAQTRELRDSFVSIEHGVFLSKKYNLTDLIPNIKRIRVAHGSGGELAYVAAGYLDAVIKTDQSVEHFSGGRAILEIAGGIVVDFSGQRAPIHLDKKKKIDYIATTKLLLPEMLGFVS